MMFNKEIMYGVITRCPQGFGQILSRSVIFISVEATADGIHKASMYKFV